MEEDTVKSATNNLSAHVPGSDHASPYPVSRLAPAFGLVDLAAEIAAADATVAGHANAKLGVIARQIQQLQAEARRILDQAHQDQRLHRAQCQCKRIPGKDYHLYRRDDGTEYFSLLSPREWGGRPPHQYVASYTLQADMSWHPLDAGRSPDHAQALIDSFLELPVSGNQNKSNED